MVFNLITGIEICFYGCGFSWHDANFWLYFLNFGMSSGVAQSCMLFGNSFNYKLGPRQIPTPAGKGKVLCVGRINTLLWTGKRCQSNFYISSTDSFWPVTSVIAILGETFANLPIIPGFCEISFWQGIHCMPSPVWRTETQEGESVTYAFLESIEKSDT